MKFFSCLSSYRRRRKQGYTRRTAWYMSDLYRYEDGFWLALLFSISLLSGIVEEIF